MSLNKGSIAIVLHAHLPFVRHPEYPRFLEEDWFFEAVIETYIPIISMLERLVKDGIRPALTISLSPTLCAMLEDDLLEKRCRQYLENRMELIEEEISKIGDHGPAAETAKMYRELFSQAYSIMNKYSGDLITPFKQLQQAGQIEVITCSATHALLPLIIHPESLRAQITAAADDYNDRFNRKTKGFWLPECGYDHRIPQFLKLAGVKYFFSESHTINYSRPRPKMGIYAPLKTPSGVMTLGRDAESAREVWSSKFGYPGDPAYREFYKDLGFDADYDYIKPYLHPDGVRRSIGIKYHRITGTVDLAGKELYDPSLARAAAEKHALDFIKKRLKQADDIYAEKGIRPIITGTYDAELFGHWWFEGPLFLENVLRKIRQERAPLQVALPSECIETYPQPQEAEPEISSWGDRGYFEPWANGSNDWIYPPIIASSEKMIEAANRFRHQNLSYLETRALNQAARETLLAQSSDWAFLMNVGTHPEYAAGRVRLHCKNSARLISMVTDKCMDERELQQMEAKNNIFPRMDFRIFASASAF